MEKKHWIRNSIILLILFFFILFLYSFLIEPHLLKTKEIKIVDSHVTDGFHGLKIVHLSDIHYGRSILEKDLKRIQKEVNRLKPDLIFFTGDLFEHGISITEEQKKSLTDFLKGMNAEIGKYAISGEDDYGRSDYSIILENGDFVLLDEKYDSIYNEKNEVLFLAGMSTTSNGTKNAKDKTKPIFDYLNSLEPQTNEKGEVIHNPNKPSYSILLMHEADSIQEIDYSKFQLVLAGHSHLGQVRLPFIGGIYYPNGSKNFKNGEYLLEETKLYISPGLGTTRYPIRFLNIPQINFYRLTNH